VTWDRKQRWEAILQEKIAVIVQQRLNDPRLGFVTVTRTELTKDRKLCRVFFTVLGTDGQRRRSERALADAGPRVQELLAPTLRMRSMPELRFVYDETVERESRLLGLIDEVAEERREWEAHQGPPGDGEGGTGEDAPTDAPAAAEPPATDGRPPADGPA